MLLQEKLNVTVEHCGCGKECEVWDNRIKEKVLTNLGTYEYKEMLVHIGYPMNHCHCACGVEFGKHECKLVGKAKKRCVACRKQINPDDYEANGNYCLECNEKAEMSGAKRVEFTKFLEELDGQKNNSVSSDTGLGEDKQGQESDTEA